MAILTQFQSFSLPISGEPPVAAGRATTPRTLAVSGEVDPWMGSCATATTVTIYDATTSPVKTILWCWIQADQDIFIEYQGALAANNSTVKVKAGFPEVNSTGTIRTYSALGNFGGSATQITKILARNESGTTTTIRAFSVS
jgi:hypothetical protein